MMPAYSVPRPEGPIDLFLDGNEGAGPDPALADRLSASGWNRYPSTRPLEAQLAHRLGLRPEQVLVTAGGDDALLRAFRVRAGREVVLPSPSFSMLPRFAAWTGSPVREVPWAPGTPWPLAQVLDALDGNTATSSTPTSPDWAPPRFRARATSCSASSPTPARSSRASPGRASPCAASPTTPR